MVHISCIKMLFKILKVKVAQSCPTLCDSMGYTVHGSLQARILEWIVVPFSRGSSQPRDQTQFSHIAGRFSALWGFPGSSIGKELTCNAGDPSSIPGLGRSPGERNNYPLQYSGLENSMDCIVHGVTKNRTQLSDFHFTSLHSEPPGMPPLRASSIG